MSSDGEGYKKTIIGSVIASLIAFLIQKTLLMLMSYWGVVHPAYEFFENNFLLLAFSLIVGVLYFGIARHVKVQQKENMPRSFFVKYPPDNIWTIYKKEHFGVNWKVKIGTAGPPVFSIDPYAVVEGPYCPKCGYKLDTYTKISFFGWKDKYYWRCEPCNKLYRRPDETLFREGKVVEKIAMNEFEKKMKKENIDLDRRMWSER